MIYFLAPRDGAFGIEDYLAEWGQGLVGRLNVVLYEDLWSRTDYTVGTYVFAGLDRLSPVQHHAATRIASQLESASAEVSILNHPARTLLRYDLLRTLQRAGINRFGVTRAANAASVTQYPVFIREESAHTGALSGLLYSLGDVDRALGGAALRGYKLRDLLIVEFADTKDDAGLFHKYSAFVVGDAVVPRSLDFGKDWMLKSGTREIDEEKVLAERAYVMDNPHETILRRIFVTAHVEYGRIDYSVVGRQVFAWEINLNPTIGRGPSRPPSGRIPEHLRPLRAEAKAHFYHRFREAFEAVDTVKETHRIVVRLEAATTRRLAAEARARARASKRKRIYNAIVEDPRMNPIRSAYAATRRALSPMVGRLRRLLIL